MTIRFIEEIPIEGKRTFIRVDFNVPITNGRITDDTRVQAALATVRHAVARGAKVILASHLGRPKGVRSESLRLEPIGARLAELLEVEIVAADDCIGDGVRKLSQDLRDGDVLLLENLRFYKEETENDPIFADKLAQCAEVYINDAFGTLHRSHASTVGMVKHFKNNKGAGYLVRKELKFLRDTLSNPDRPFVAILGGAKVSDKIGVIQNLLNKVDVLLIGGAMAYTLMKAKGLDVGNCPIEVDRLRVASQIIKTAEERNIKLILPEDHQVASDPNAQEGQAAEVSIPAGMLGLDIGPKTLEMFIEEIKHARIVFWNGPVGVFEKKPFQKGTFGIAHALAESKAISIVGGGDSVAAVNQIGLAEKISHISTGGGASIEFLEGKTLPGLAVLEV